jgi:hypothetical protein
MMPGCVNGHAADRCGPGTAALPEVVVAMTDGLAVLAAWCEFGLLLACLAFVVLRGDRRGQ